MKIFLLALLCFFTCSAYGQYKFLAVPEDSVSAYYYNETSIKKGKSRIENTPYVEVWLKRTSNKGLLDSFRKIELRARKAHKLKTAGYGKYAYSLMRWQVSCETRRCRIIQSVDYDIENKILDSYNKKDLEVDWDPIERKTMAERLHQFLCDRK